MEELGIPEPSDRICYGFLLMIGIYAPFMLMPAIKLFDPQVDPFLTVARYFLLIGQLITLPLCGYLAIFFFRVMRVLLTFNYPMKYTIPVRYEVAFNTPPRQPVIVSRPIWTPAPPNTKGYVYLLKSPTGHYKIGKATYPEKRLKEIEILMPFEIERIHLIDCEDYNIAERELQLEFREKRTNGEWFLLDDEDVAFIMSLKTDHDVYMELAKRNDQRHEEE